MERWLCGQELLLLFQETRVWCAVPKPSNTHLPVTIALRYAMPSVGPAGSYKHVLTLKHKNKKTKSFKKKSAYHTFFLSKGVPVVIDP